MDGPVDFVPIIVDFYRSNQLTFTVFDGPHKYPPLTSKLQPDMLKRSRPTTRAI